MRLPGPLTLADLAQSFWCVHGVTVSCQTVGRVLCQMGYRNLRRHPRDYRQGPDTIDTFKSMARPRSASMISRLSGTVCVNLSGLSGERWALAKTVIRASWS